MTESSTLTLESHTAVSTSHSHNLTRDFLNGGNAIFTVQLPSDFAIRNDLPDHYTFRVRRPKADKSPDEQSTIHFVEMLVGPDNGSDYEYIGCFGEQGQFTITRKSKLIPDGWVFKIVSRVIRRIWDGECEMITEAGWSVLHNGCCARCGRTLTTPESIRAGLGPKCRGEV